MNRTKEYAFSIEVQTKDRPGTGALAQQHLLLLQGTSFTKNTAKYT